MKEYKFEVGKFYMDSISGAEFECVYRCSDGATFEIDGERWGGHIYRLENDEDVEYVEVYNFNRHYYFNAFALNK